MALTETRSYLTTEYLYDGQQPLIELKSDGTRTDYVLGFNGMPLARTVTQGETSATDYYLYDGLGCVMALGNASFSITQTLEYDVWGSQRAGQGSSTNALRYAGSLGHVSDAETGLTYMRARYYDPDVGRFLSEDPGRHGSNWYRYASDNPVNRGDATGRSDFSLGGLVGAMSISSYLASASAAASQMAQSIVFGAVVGASADAAYQVIYSLITTGQVSVDGTEVAAWAAGGGLTGGLFGMSGVLSTAITENFGWGAFFKHLAAAAGGGAAGGGLAGAIMGLKSRSQQVSDYMDALDAE